MPFLASGVYTKNYTWGLRQGVTLSNPVLRCDVRYCFASFFYGEVLHINCDVTHRIRPLFYGQYHSEYAQRIALERTTHHASSQNPLTTWRGNGMAPSIVRGISPAALEAAPYDGRHILVCF